MAESKSLDQIERESFEPGPSPISGHADVVALAPGGSADMRRPLRLCLDGDWLLAGGGAEAQRLSAPWEDAIPALVPGSVHSALLAAGRIPDPYIGRNDEIAKRESFKTWWLMRRFKRPTGIAHARLVFGGICDSCSVWLNGEKLGDHTGMFAELNYDVSALLVDGENTIVVRLDPVPVRISSGEPNDFFLGMNVGWLDTAVINNIYGWHYIDLPTLGIWRSVTLREQPEVSIEDPFVATLDAGAGLVRLHTRLKSGEAGFSGCLQGAIEPENFAGHPCQFTYQVAAAGKAQDVLLELQIPEARQWWPVDYGQPNLYRMRLAFVSEGEALDCVDFTFGIRTIEMAPLPGGPDPELYNWTFVVNGKPIFVKGANWCTLDALLRFDRHRYERFLHLARDSHMQLLRAWGSGMPETDEFYDVADRCGLMILQEWPTAWNSHRIQPYDILEETVRHNTIRLRNHPSLVMWGGGNESGEPFGEAIDMMGRASYELDGSRAFHRGEPWGGSIHSYHVFWQYQPLNYNLTLSAPFIGEFGLASLPNYESVERYLPAEELEAWPPASDSGFTHRMPVFNLKAEQAIMAQYVADFVAMDSLKNFILGMQMAQATGMRHTLELARTRWPQATGICYYKLTDNNPAASWASIDWYGVPKIAYHILRQAYRPLHACLLFNRLSFIGAPVSFPVFLLDDIGAIAGTDWEVRVRAFGGDLTLLKQESYAGSGSGDSVRRLGEFSLDAEQSWNIPLLIVAEVIAEDGQRDRVFYWLNYTSVQGCLFDLPRTQLSLGRDKPGQLRLANTGDKPAAGVHFVYPEGSDEFSCDDSYFWLEPGEERNVLTSHQAGVRAAAWNADETG